MSTYFPKEGEIVRKWFVVDASGQPLGRLASRVARILMGKENPKYTPFIDTGDHVVVINAEQVKITGMKVEQKAYHHYTGLSGRTALGGSEEASGAQAGAGDRTSRFAHAAEEQTRQADVHEAEGI